MGLFSGIMSTVVFFHDFIADLFSLQLPSDGQTAQQTGVSRVAAVGPYIQSSTMPRGPSKQDLLIKNTYPDGTATVPHQEKSARPGSGLHSMALKIHLHLSRIYFIQRSTICK